MWSQYANSSWVFCLFVCFSAQSPRLGNLLIVGMATAIYYALGIWWRRCGYFGLTGEYLRADNVNTWIGMESLEMVLLGFRPCIHVNNMDVSPCHCLNVCILLKRICWNPVPHGRCWKMRPWGSRVIGAEPHEWDSCLYFHRLESDPLTISSTHRARVFTRHQIHLDLSLPSSRIMRCKFLLFINLTAHGILLEQLKWTKKKTWY